MARSRLSLEDLPFAENPVLFGADRVTGLVNVELGRKKGHVKLWWRRGRAVEKRYHPFRPFLWLADRRLLAGWKGPVEVEILEGEGAFRFLVRAPDFAHIRKLSQHIASVSGVSPAHPDSPQVFPSDPVNQYLMESGRTLFGGLAFSDLVRMQVRVVPGCPPGYDFPHPDRDPLRIIALADSTGWEEVLGPGEDEQELIEGFLTRVARRDPDVLEGHGLLKFDLPYLARRWRRRTLPLGREGQAARCRRTRMQIAERTVDYLRWDVPGRDLVDTWILAQQYDVSTRDLESYELGVVARRLEVASEDWKDLSMGELAALCRDDPEAARAHVAGEVRQVRRLASALSYPYFLQARIFPYAYQDVVLRGTATRINSLLLREYLRQRVALPARSAVKPYQGGLTAQEHSGLAFHVLHCDVASLYPSVMLAYGIGPSQDHLGVFRKLLKDLRDFRLEARRRQQEASDPDERELYGALQRTFKILINSFYGYLGFAQGQFADSEQAAEVTRRGRELLTRMIEWLKGRGARILEVDTDGIYFVPPPEGEEDLIEELNRQLPEGVQVEVAGRYRAMYVHRVKNYALLDHQGRVTITGSGLRSRSYEPFLRRFLEELLTLTLKGRSEEIPALYEEYCRKLEAREFDIRELARSDTLQDTLAVYRKKIEAGSRNRAAAYELALASGRDYRPGDRVSYYVTGEKANVTVYDNCRLVADHDPAHPDENVAYYRKKLRDLYRRFR